MELSDWAPRGWGLVICTQTGFPVDSCGPTFYEDGPAFDVDPRPLSLLPPSHCHCHPPARALRPDPSVPSLGSLSVLTCGVFVWLGPFRKIVYQE